MSKHLDWSRITPDVAVWCKTEEEDLAFRQACEERGILWVNGHGIAGRSCFTYEKSYYTVKDYSLYSVTGVIGYTIPYSDLLVEDKPRICEILGVEVGERFNVPGKRLEISIDEKGRLSWHDREHIQAFNNLGLLQDLINDPSIIIRKPRFTPDELAMLRCFAAAGVESIERYHDGIVTWKTGDRQGALPSETLLSIRPGQSVTLAAVLK
ncbi:hypothetical protein KL86CLO1_11647 [uncultured Eubacteriales bacterium]|uniref:Uncharacterized protein n=1 Tax=uncultured Eubacteriales bacterium TaxID=172733 RepID=A0A212JT18_9FIRM|nr:hypothetical protein KL86CLO1_11647 [uncultured Eubacteriales bacterium]